MIDIMQRYDVTSTVYAEAWNAAGITTEGINYGQHGKATFMYGNFF